MTRSIIGLTFYDLTYPLSEDYDTPEVYVLATFTVAGIGDMVKFRREDGSIGAMDRASFADYFGEKGPNDE